MKQRMYYITILIWVALAIWPLPVSAHTKMVQSIPAANAQLEQSPEDIRLEYNADFDTSLSSVTIHDDTGKIVEGALNTETARWLIYEVPPLSGGIYTVHWKVLSADTHVVEGSFAFSVSELKPNVTPIASATPIVAETEPVISSSPPPSHSIMTDKPSLPTKETAAVNESDMRSKLSAGTIYPLARVLEVLAAIASAGFIIFRYGIWGILRKEAPPLFSIRNERLVYIIASLIFVLSGALQVTMLAEQLQGAAGSYWGLVRTILTETLVGTATWLKPAAAVILLITAFGFQGVSRTAFLMKLAAISLIIVLFPLTGHAYGASTGVLYAVLSQILHMVAAAVWLGGLIGIHSAMGSRQQTGLNYGDLNKLILRFSAIALPSLIMIAISGVILAYMRLGSWNALIDSSYGQLIFAKSAIVLLVLFIACFHRLVLIPRMGKALMAPTADQDQEIPRKFILGVRLEILMAILALVMAGTLSTTPPPDPYFTAEPVYWHEMGDTAHMSMRVSFGEKSSQILKLDVWLPTGTGAPENLAVQLVQSGEENSHITVPLTFITGGPDPYGFEGFDKFTYEASGGYFSKSGEWRATITFIDSTGEAHSYEKTITL